MSALEAVGKPKLTVFGVNRAMVRRWLSAHTLEIRRSKLLYPGKPGSGLVELVARSRYRTADNLHRYLIPSLMVLRGIASLLGPVLAGRR